MIDFYTSVDCLYSVIEQNLNLYVVISIVLTALGLFSFMKSNNLFFHIFSGVSYMFWGIGVEILLFGRGLINDYLLLASIFLVIIQMVGYVLQRFLKGNGYSFFSIYSKIEFLRQLFTLGISVCFVLYIDYFDSHSILKFSFCFIYLLSFLLEWLRFKRRNNFFKEHNDKSEAYIILMMSSGTTFIPFVASVFIWNHLLLVGTLLMIFSRVQPSKTNYGVFHTMNRDCLVTDGKDGARQFLLFVVIVTIFISNGYNIDSFMYGLVVVGFWPVIRLLGASVSKYYTVFVGEKRGYRPKLYDNLITRVNPGQSIGFWSRIKVGNSENNYSLFFHNHRLVYDDSQGLIKSDDIVNKSSHLIVIFNEEAGLTNFVCELDLITTLRSPVIIVDVWQSKFKNPEFLFGDLSADLQWLNTRLNIIQRISDEPFGEVSESYSDAFQKSDDLKLQAQQVNMRQAIVNSSSFESLRQNIQLFEHQYKEADHERVKQLTGKGIYELNTLFRQLHESPSIPSRFIDLLNVAECMIRYLVGFVHAERVGDGKILHANLPFDTKAIAFGSCTDFLARWKKSDAAGETKLGARISALLDVVYDDTENVEALVKYIRIMNPGVTAKYSQKPTLLELSWWMVTVRNKTRGHGTPSKVDYGFYVCLEKAVLFMLAECSKLELTPCYIAGVDGQKWTFHLSSGGYPEPVPVVVELQKGVHFNPLLEDEMIERLTANHRRIVTNIPAGDESLYLYVTEGEKTEWWRCHKHFQVKDAIVHLLNQHDDKKESWISFSTGRIMRPEISEL